MGGQVEHTGTGRRGLGLKRASPIIGTSV